MWQYQLMKPNKRLNPPVVQQQRELANQTPFDTIAAHDELVQNAVDATALDKGKTMIGQSGAFVGTVSAARSSQNNGKVVLDFAQDRKTAMRAVLRPESFSRFPDMQTLVGKKVLVQGVFVAHQDRVEVQLSQREQIHLVS